MNKKGNAEKINSIVIINLNFLSKILKTITAKMLNCPLEKLSKVTIRLPSASATKPEETIYNQHEEALL